LNVAPVLAAGEGAAAGVGEDRGERLLGGALRVVAGRRTALVRPGRAEPLANLAGKPGAVDHDEPRRPVFK
jgi:hypothetical protein